MEPDVDANVEPETSFRTRSWKSFMSVSNAYEGVGDVIFVQFGSNFSPVVAIETYAIRDTSVGL